MDKLFPYVEYTVYRQTYEGWHIPVRTISNHELVFIAQGNGFINIEGKTIAAKPHMLFYFYPKMQHSLWLNAPPFMKFYAVHFSFRGDEGLSKLPIEDMTIPGNHSVLENLFKELIQAREKKEYMYSWKQDLMLSRILYTIMKERHLKLSPSSISRISAVVDHIHQYPAKSFTIEELCQVGQMQKSYLIDNFKMFTGYTPIQYVTSLKLEKSKDLLADSKIPINEIAQTCGFKSEYYFSRLFRQHYGMSPREFRNNS